MRLFFQSTHLSTETLPSISETDISPFRHLKVAYQNIAALNSHQTYVYILFF